MPSLQDTGLGVSLSMMSSTDSRVGLELSILKDPDA